MSVARQRSYMGTRKRKPYNNAMFTGNDAVVLAVLFIATVVRSTFGFGEALIAVPLLALVLPVEVAAPVAVLVSVTVALIIVLQDWRHIHLLSAAWLIGSTLLGIPVGLALLYAPEPIIKAILGVIIVSFSTYSLASRAPFELHNDRWAPLFGFLAGVLGGAYGMNGPPLVIYGSLRRWSPEHFRATLQGYFLPASLVTMIGYAVTGWWTFEVTRFYLLSLPVVALAILLGRFLHRG
ncbi:MAG TPA: sulfite exporter TauE/SafE family protein, partial [Gemmataceae bacterium]|nr:sulfite exporter TauE/SafE family protein [Gemmataceae bacterium]